MMSSKVLYIGKFPREIAVGNPSDPWEIPGKSHGIILGLPPKRKKSGKILFSHENPSEI